MFSWPLAGLLGMDEYADPSQQYALPPELRRQAAQPQPQIPPDNPTSPSAASVAAPTASAPKPSQDNPLGFLGNLFKAPQGVDQGDYRRAAFDNMAKLGMHLLAAGQPMTGAQRAQVLAGAAGDMGMGTALYNAAQTRLMHQKALAAQDELAQQAKRNALLQSPSVLQSLGLTSDQATALGPQGVQAVYEKRLAINPVDEALKKAQEGHLNAQTKQLETGANNQQLVKWTDAQGNERQGWVSPGETAPQEIGGTTGISKQEQKDREAALKDAQTAKQANEILDQYINDYQAAAKAGAIGPVVGSSVGRTVGGLTHSEGERSREALDRDIARWNTFTNPFKGQGAVTDYERGLAQAVLAPMTASAPDIALQQMRDLRGQYGQQLAQFQTRAKGERPDTSPTGGPGATTDRVPPPQGNLTQQWRDKLSQARGGQAPAPQPAPAPAQQPQASPFSEGATATNPKTGQRIVFRNGRWEPMNGTAAGL